MTDHKLRVLIVDEDTDLIEQLRVILEHEGYEVHTAESASEAEEQLLSIRPDLAILDVAMEERDSGFVLCREIKKLYPETPVIILTAVRAATGISFSANTPEERSWIQADRILDKPIHPERLTSEIQRLLARRGKAVATPSKH